ncbi:ATP-dependent DNA helicase DDX11-like isoform X2 [Mercenaria mercenaria]|uniref:ATP-dependent DNA helicase DDX11-like isoform X2 n=1 Tax=Mercenaria mercenaria TaxID=6596 RepID=UPI00234F3286|nr:ATP-dependent DNA helicase DDX11-like isoform X2 [Mercenaria mercenaria]
MDDFDEEGDDLLSSLVMDKSLDVTGSNKVMYSSEPVEVPAVFPFPFEPYDIQKGFMRELYTCLQQGRVGIFESPTGTGKSLSLICGALRWLKDFQEKQKQELEEMLSEENKENSNKTTRKESGELDWISDFKVRQEAEEKSKKVKEEIEQRLKREAKLSEIKKTRKVTKRKRVQLEEDFDDLMKTASSEIKDAFKMEMEKRVEEAGDINEDDENLILDEYNSDDGGDDKKSDDEDDDDEVHCTKIYFCSRTHSQLSQFVREVIKSPYGDDTRVISLGSRQNLCVNEAVRRLKSLSLINDTCRDLQKKKSEKKDKSETKRKKTGSSQGCPYYKQDPIQDFKDSALVDVRDIEQLVSLGKQMKACPYYGTRLAVPDAEIVALPYNTLLHKSTREASRIQLKDNIVIIDEAHNLLETINNVHSTEVTGAQLVRAHSQLSQYEAKYRSRLKAQNLMYIKQILFILGNLTKCIGGKTDQHPDKQSVPFAETRLWTINDFLFHSQLDNVNMFKILRYCQRSQISRKLHGFVEKYRPEIVISSEKEKKQETSTSSLSSFLKSLSGKGNDTEKVSEPAESVEEKSDFVMSSPLMHIESFLLALTNADKDGRIVISKQKLFSQCSIKFLLLNPAVHFASVVQEARAVVVAGGTMQPISEFKDQLFHAAGVQPERILEYSCGHVIPGEQLLPLAVSTGPTGVQLDFTYTNRNKTSLLDELGRLVCNICNIVPGGVICFFSSYDYEKFVYSHWENSGVLAKLQNRKKVFREPKRAGQADKVLQDYTTCIQNCSGSITGSILFCVVGGKMSEGINFSDDLGRCVMMVGMPYPNINSPELKEKMDYLNANFPKDKEGRQPGQVHYENLCMKAVNQSIGRAIRHQGDYATILLLDRRYSRAGTVAKLPGWISKHLQKMDKFGNVFSAVSKFFSAKKKS